LTLNRRAISVLLNPSAAASTIRERLTLDTAVGPGGRALSGGQRRRLSVAQGLLRRADALLLDEPTESLDAQTAARLLIGVRAYDPHSALVIALHNRQSLQLPWTPNTSIELSPGGAGPIRGSGS
jgi:ATP-binding cassette subfamily C protein CydC